MAEKQKIIEAEDVDVCGYGIFWLLNIIEFLLVSVILGTVLRILPGALAFLYPFFCCVFSAEAFTWIRN